MGSKEKEGKEEKESLGAVGAAGIFIIRKREEDVSILLAERKGKLELDRLSPPGGRLEEGEELPGCAIREVWEETGLRIDSEDLICIYRGAQTFTRTGVAFEYNGFLVIWREDMGIPQDKEPKRHGPWQWIDGKRMEELLENNQLSAAAEMLWKAYCRYEEFPVRRKLGLGVKEVFEPLEESVVVARLFAETQRHKLQGEYELLDRISETCVSNSRSLP
jgi:8-oxo-dGTP pyrophosphatase MutT (NUDIX family)